MARKPNYKFERLERQRQKAAKKAEKAKAKAEKAEQTAAERDDRPGGGPEEGA